MHIDQILDNILPLPASSRSLMLQNIREISFPKGHLLLKAERIEPYFYFLKKGLVRAFTIQGETEVTFWFGKEGDAIISMKSYVSGQKAYESIELLEDSELYQIKSEDLQALYQKDNFLANWGRKLAEQELVRTEELFISRQFRPAASRYTDLLLDNPDLIHRVQLRHIASFLGITQVSLSRIRAEIASGSNKP